LKEPISELMERLCEEKKVEEDEIIEVEPGAK
jgi:hypothetical protein